MQLAHAKEKKEQVQWRPCLRRYPFRIHAVRDCTGIVFRGAMRRSRLKKKAWRWIMSKRGERARQRRMQRNVSASEGWKVAEAKTGLVFCYFLMGYFFWVDGVAKTVGPVGLPFCFVKKGESE